LLSYLHGGGIESTNKCHTFSNLVCLSDRRRG